MPTPARNPSRPWSPPRRSSKRGPTCSAHGETLTADSQATVAEEHDMLNFSCGNEPGFGPPTTGRLSFSSNPSLISEASAAAPFLRGGESGGRSSSATPR